MAYLEQFTDKLDEDSKRRMYTNPLRVLDSKNPDVQALLNDAPALGDYLDEESKAHFAGLCALLDDAGIRYTVNQRPVRGLDYYNRTVFEWVTTSLGSRGHRLRRRSLRRPRLSSWAVALPRAWVLPWVWNVLFYWSEAVNPEFKADPVVDIYR